MLIRERERERETHTDIQYLVMWFSIICSFSSLPPSLLSSVFLSHVYLGLIMYPLCLLISWPFLGVTQTLYGCLLFSLCPGRNTCPFVSLKVQIWDLTAQQETDSLFSTESDNLLFQMLLVLFLVRSRLQNNFRSSKWPSKIFLSILQQGIVLAIDFLWIHIE